MSEAVHQQKEVIEGEVLTIVSRAISAVQKSSGYGSIEVTVHDGKVTQIECRERVRLHHQTVRK